MNSADEDKPKKTMLSHSNYWEGKVVSDFIWRNVSFHCKDKPCAAVHIARQRKPDLIIQGLKSLRELQNYEPEAS